MAEIKASTSRGEDRVEPVRDAFNHEADRTCAESVTSGITSESPSFCTWILTACTRMWGARASGLSVPRFGQRALGCEAQTRDESESEVSSRIKAPTSTWSEVPGRFSDQVQDRANASVWAELKEMSPEFFRDDVGDRVVVGRLIAEGGQAEIYEAKFESLDESLQFGDIPTGSGFIVKVFKLDAGFSLADLQRHWPRHRGTPGMPRHLRNFVFGDAEWNNIVGRCVIWCATLLPGGSFAFLMERYWGDLRTLIDLKVKDNTVPGEFDLSSASGRQHPPFTFRETLSLMSEIAQGMFWMHTGGVVLHRDLKAANVLLRHEGGFMSDWLSKSFHKACHVADYECAMFVQGTGFWRAPEVLQELQKNEGDRNADIWTKKVDVYSYGMTCYEILTGEIPFAGCTKRKWDDVIRGERPPLPTYVDPRLRDLVEKCWHSDPSRRPTFDEIWNDLIIITDSSDLDESN